MAGYPVLVRRLRHARLSLDRATLWLWDESFRGGSGSGRNPPGLLPPEAIAGRYRWTAFEQIELRLPVGLRTEWREKVVNEIRRMRR